MNNMEDKAVRERVRRMAAEGRLVETSFQTFMKAVFPDAPKNQEEALRTAFFGGVTELHSLTIFAISEERNDKKSAEFVQAWVDECRRYYETIFTGLGPKDG